VYLGRWMMDVDNVALCHAFLPQSNSIYDDNPMDLPRRRSQIMSAELSGPEGKEGGFVCLVDGDGKYK